MPHRLAHIAATLSQGQFIVHEGLFDAFCLKQHMSAVSTQVLSCSGGVSHGRGCCETC